MAVRIHRNIAWSYANWASQIVVPLVMIPIYLRCLGDRTYGAWLVILSITGYLSLANLGMGQTLNNRIAEAVAQDRRDEIGPLVSTTFFGYAAIAGVLTLALAAGTPLIARRLSAGTTAGVIAPFFVYVALVMLSFPFKVFPMVLRGFERVDQDQAIITLSNLMRMIVLAVALFSGFKLMAVAVVNGSAEILTPLAQYWLSKRLVRDLRPQLSKFSRRVFMELIRPSAGFFGIQVSNTLISGVDNLVVGYALGAAAVTAYAVPFRIITVLVGLLSVAVNAVNPTVTVSFAQGTRHSLGRGYLFSLRLSTLYGTAGAIALWIAGPTFLHAWAGADVFPGYRAYALMIMMFTMTVLIMPASSILWATTRHYVWAMMSLGEGALNLGLSLFLVRHFGLSGVIAATVVASLMLTFWYLPYAALRTLEVSLASALRELAPGFALSGAALAVVAMLWDSHSAVSLTHALAWAAVAVSAYAGLFALVGFTRSQRQVMFRWLSAARRGAAIASSDAA